MSLLSSIIRLRSLTMFTVMCHSAHSRTGKILKKSGAIDKNTPPPPHKPIIPNKVSKYIFPVIQELSKTDLLECCLQGATQNPNESFRNVIWSLAPKTSFCSATTLRFTLHFR